MDIKSLSTIIGRVINEMHRTTAVKINRGIGKAKPQPKDQTVPQKPASSAFQAYKGQRRKAGAGCVSQINEKLWEGRYSPV